MSNSIKHLINQFNLQTRLFNNVTVGITNTDANRSMNENTNHIAWLTGHTVSTRFMLASVLGLKVKEPFPEYFEDRKGIDKNVEYPTMKNLTKDWHSISDQTVTALNGLSEEAINSKMPQPVPTGETLGDFISFIIHHEAYTIGQLGIYRRFHGLAAMKYN